MYRDIAVTLDPRPTTVARVAAAVNLAHSHGARLLGVDLTVTDDLDGRWRCRAEAARAIFDDSVAKTGIPGQYIRIAQGNFLPSFPSHAVDLIVTDAGDPDDGTSQRSGMTERLLRSSGVPVLVLPTDWASFSVATYTTVIAWNGSSEATRAVHDALPLLYRATNLVVFACTPDGDPAPHAETQPFLDHLERHGLTAKLHRWPDLGADAPVDLLLECLRSERANLLVAGAHGHAKWHDAFCSSLTSTVIRQSTIPLLMSH